MGNEPGTKLPQTQMGSNGPCSLAGGVFGSKLYMIDRSRRLVAKAWQDGLCINAGVYRIENDDGSGEGKKERKRRVVRWHEAESVLHRMPFGSKACLGQAFGANSLGTTPAIVQGRRRRAAEARE